MYESNFRPLIGVIISNRRYNNKAYKKLSNFRPLIGVIISNQVIDGVEVNQNALPSPYRGYHF